MNTGNRAHRLGRRLVLSLFLLLGSSDWIVPVVVLESWARDGQAGDAVTALTEPQPGEGTPDDPAVPRSKAKRAKTARKGVRHPTKDVAKSQGSSSKGTAATPDASLPKFSRDVAPMLVGNCVGCHTKEGAGLRKSKLDLSNFETLMAGTPSHKVVVPGRPETSPLYLRIHGDLTPSMPQGDRTLSEAAVEKVERWIKAGASLDPGLDRKAAFSTYVASAEELRKFELAKRSVDERDKKCEEVGRARIAQADPKLKPEIARGDHTLLFANMPGGRANQALKVLETEYVNLRKTLGHAAPESLEKISVYVFNDRKALIEFIRSVEGREVEVEVQATARLSVPQPYIAVLDPAHGGEEPIHPTKRRTGRSKKKAEESSALVADRSLAGLMTETLVTGTVEVAGKAPGWLSSGLGAYFASRLEPRSAHFQQLRADALEARRADWNAKASEILADGPEMKSKDMKAIGYSIVAWLHSPGIGRAFPRFAAGLIKDPSDLDGLLKSVYQTTREEFLADAGEWVAERFGNAPAPMPDVFSE